MDTNTLLLAVSAIVLGGAVYFLLSLKWSLTGNLGQRIVNPLKGNPNDPLSLFGFFVPVAGLTTSISPFTSKVETYLRMNGIKFASENTDFKSSPNGRVTSHNFFTINALINVGVAKARVSLPETRSHP